MCLRSTDIKQCNPKSIEKNMRVLIICFFVFVFYGCEASSGIQYRQLGSGKNAVSTASSFKYKNFNISIPIENGASLSEEIADLQIIKYNERFSIILVDFEKILNKTIDVSSKANIKYKSWVHLLELLYFDRKAREKFVSAEARLENGLGHISFHKPEQIPVLFEGKKCFLLNGNDSEQTYLLYVDEANKSIICLTLVQNNSDLVKSTFEERVAILSNISISYKQPN